MEDIIKRIKVVFGILGFFLLILIGIGSATEPPKSSYKPLVNSWNGVPFAVSEFLKENLRDPNSLEYVKSYQVYEMDNLPESENKKYYQKTTYRAKNGFGGYVVETKTFIIQNNKVIGVM